jgi:DNA modification methylase
LAAEAGRVILHGNAIDVLKTLPANTFHTCVTSPPYWSLRDYGVPPTVWGGNPKCEHEWVGETFAEGFSGKRKWQHSANGRGDASAAPAASMPAGSSRRGVTTITRAAEPGVWTHVSQGTFCRWCGAWRGCLGLEPTIDLYVAHLVAIFAEVRRVLRKDGTCWLNIGDSYATDNATGQQTAQGGLLALSDRTSPRKKPREKHAYADGRVQRGPKIGAPTGLKPKDLCMIPARVALALQADGWYLRADIVWSKTNPMPESIQDRPTKSHEYVYLLAKSERYYFDAHAIREGVTGTSHHRGDGLGVKARVINENVPKGLRPRQNASFSAAVNGLVSSRNRRSVWTIATAPFKGAHFATFPPKLVEPCILAGTSEHGCCAVCGAPYTRIVKLGAEMVAQKRVGGCNKDGQYHGKPKKDYRAAGVQDPSAVKTRILAGMRERLTVGWKPTCKHSDAELQPCRVLDPFGGAMTTTLVGEQLGREVTAIELSAEYIGMGEQRLAKAAETLKPRQVLPEHAAPIPKPDVEEDLPLPFAGAEPGSPLAVGAGQTGETVTTEGWSGE